MGVWGWGGAALLLVLAMADSASGIRCHSCNSVYDSNCGDPYNAYTTELVDCEQERRKMTHVDGISEHEAFCRKTVQIIEGDSRVQRSCGFLPNTGSLKDRTCFTRTGTHHISVQHCVCKGNACNSSPLLPSSSPLLTLLLLSSLIFTVSRIFC